MKTTLITYETRAEYNALMKLYERKGWMWSGGQQPAEFNGYTPDGGVTYADGFIRNVNGNREDYILVPFAMLAALESITTEREKAHLQVGDYTATVDYDTKTVKIHTENIDFDKIVALHNLITFAE